LPVKDLRKQGIVRSTLTLDREIATNFDENCYEDVPGSGSGRL